MKVGGVLTHACGNEVMWMMHNVKTLRTHEEMELLTHGMEWMHVEE